MIAWTLFTAVFLSLLVLAAATGIGSASSYLSMSEVLAIAVSLSLACAAELTRGLRPPLSAWLRVCAEFWILASVPISAFLAYEVFGLFGVVLILLVVTCSVMYRLRHQAGD